MCAWESLSTLTGMGITLTATGPGVLGPVAQHQAEYQTQKNVLQFLLTRFLVMTLGSGGQGWVIIKKTNREEAGIP